MNAIELVCVALGAAAGGTARYATTHLLRSRLPGHGDAPGTTAVNAVGAFLLGILGHLLARGALSVTPYALLGIGFCGALTTWSTLARGVAERALGENPRGAATYLVANLVLGLVACWAGWHLAG